MKRVNCLNCRYFKITWNPKHPRACTFFGFKTTKMPSQLVLESTGEPCQQYTLRKKVRPGE